MNDKLGSSAISNEDGTLQEVAFATAPTWNGNVSPREKAGDNYFKHAEWSPDGTCVITNSADNHIRTYVVPPDLLEKRPNPHNLVPYSVVKSLEPVNVVKCYPLFDLQDPATTFILSTASDHPLRLNAALTGDLVASYPLVSATTEAYIKPHSLAFTDDGKYFIAGSDSLMSIFDLSRPGQKPVQTFKTGPRSNKAVWSNPGTSLRGIVSALSLDNRYNVLAAGTLSRQIGLYDSRGQGECVGVFSVATNEADLKIGGGGITQLKWSGNGTYLYIAERKADGIMIYDIRQSGQLVCWLEGRGATTNQRMTFDLKETGPGNEHEVWAGSTDGLVRCWKTPYLADGAVSATQQNVLHSDAVNSVSLHQDAGVIATSCGQKHFENVATDDEHHYRKSKLGSKSELKLWSKSVICT